MPRRVVVGPLSVMDGAAILRVIDVDGRAVPERWNGSSWSETEQWMLAETLPGRARELSPAEVAELGISSTIERHALPIVFEPLSPDVQLPMRATSESAGYDLSAHFAGGAVRVE